MTLRLHRPRAVALILMAVLLAPVQAFMVGVPGTQQRGSLSRGMLTPASTIAPLLPFPHQRQRKGRPLGVHPQSSESPPPTTAVEEATTIMDIPIPAALTTALKDNFPSPSTNSSNLVAAALALLDGEPMDAATMAKWTNLVVVLGAGIYALSLLITVDMDNWRGWTLQEIMLRIPYDNWQEYEGGLSTHPILVKTVINVVIYLVGDWMSQVSWGKSKNLLEFDLGRTLRNGLIGAMFGPLVHYYYDFSDWILPMDVPINRVFKIVMDQTVYFVAKCSAYIALVGLLRGDDPAQVGRDVKERIWPVVFRGWRFWPLAHIVTYGFIPPRHRVLWVNTLDLVWSSILSSLASKDGAGTEDAAATSAAVDATTNHSLPPLPPSAPTTLVMASSAEEKRAEEQDDAGAAAAAAAAAGPLTLLPVAAEELPVIPPTLRSVDDGVVEGAADLLMPLERKTAGSILDEELRGS